MHGVPDVNGRREQGQVPPVDKEGNVQARGEAQGLWSPLEGVHAEPRDQCQREGRAEVAQRSGSGTTSVNNLNCTNKSTVQHTHNLNQLDNTSHKLDNDSEVTRCPHDSEVTRCPLGKHGASGHKVLLTKAVRDKLSRDNTQLRPCTTQLETYGVLHNTRQSQIRAASGVPARHSSRPGLSHIQRRPILRELGQHNQW